ncbi:MAG: penicillin acylase family protein [Promethearchaeota archaeon]
MKLPNSTSLKIIRLITSCGIAAGMIVVLSMPLGVNIPALGNLLNPYGGFWSIDHRTPEVMNINMPGMEGSTVIIRDEWGVPHIYADSETDASMVMGYLHAGDRLFQLEMILRQGRGELSEVAGEVALDLDKLARTERLHSAAENQTRWIKENQPETFEILEKYVAGVNYYISHVGNNLPLEFHLLGIKPTLWQPSDTITVEKIMAEMLTFNTGDLVRTMLNQSISSQYPGAMDELYPLYTPFQKPITLDYGHYPDEHQIVPFDVGGSISNPTRHNVNAIISWIERARDQAPIPSRSGFGSNNWAIGPNKSTTNSTFLCNDMHLEWTLPNIWYEAHVVVQSTGLNIQGFTLPGTPVIVVGHNENLAWGLTNSNMDAIDWYVYEANDTHYKYKDQWLPFQKVVEDINVKGRTKPEKYEIKYTIHGPVMDVGYMNTTNQAIAFRWAAITNTSVESTYQAIIEMMYAKNLDEFNAALSKWTLPSQNVVYADRFGNIAIRCTGWVPIRDGVDKDSDAPRFLLNGTLGEHEWTGAFIPFDELPYTVNPAQGYIVSANQLSAGPNYSYYFQHSMDSGYRARRINELIASDTDGVTLNDLKAIQNDVYDKIAEWFIPHVLRVFNNDSTYPQNEKSPIISAAIGILQAWNDSDDKYKMLANLSAPTIFQSIFEEYKILIFDEFYNISNEPYFIYPSPNVIENLTINDENSKWFDLKNTTDAIENRDDIIKLAIISGISYLQNEPKFQNLQPELWLYGDIHQVEFHHLTWLPPLGAGPYPANGSGVTPAPARTSIHEQQITARWGASERIIIDFSRASFNFDTSLIVIPGGSSGDPVSKHYTDELQLFLSGTYHEMNYFPNSSEFPESKIESTWNFH